MKKPKKITVTHYLNKILKPDLTNGLEYYGVYILTVVNRTNTKTKSIINEKFTSIEMANKKYFNEFETERKNIENHIRKKLLLDNDYCFKVPKNEMIKRKKSIIRGLRIKLKKQETELLKLEQYNLF
jgi:hypothetical protein